MCLRAWGQSSDAEQELDEDARLIASMGLAYDPERIQAYFAKRPKELDAHASSVWSSLVGLALPALVGAFGTWFRLVTANPQPKERDVEAAWAELRREIAPRVVSTLNQLGPTYIKFGQSLASRPDVVSVEIASELLQLQDAVPAFDGRLAEHIISRELSGRGPAAEELVESLKGTKPVAAASLGQVYKGRVNGRDVAVKVQRPDVRRTVALDAALLKGLARRIAALRIPVPAMTPAANLRGDTLSVPLVRADLVGAVDEFCSRLFEELDYSNEAANIQRFAALYGRSGTHAARIPAPGVRVPQLLDEFCSRRILVMEWIDGERLVPAGSDGSDVGSEGDMALVEIGIEATLLQLLETGVMHTDPHGGNLWKVPWTPTSDGSETEVQHTTSQLVYLDFGLIADVPLQVRNGLVCAVMYIIQKRWDRVAGLFNQLMLLPDWVLQNEQTLAAFTADIEAASRYALDFDSAGPDGVPSLRFSALLEQLAFLAPRYAFRLPPYFLNNARAIGCLEGMARSADPDFNILRRMYPFALRRLLANPSESPVVEQTLRDLARDERTGFLSQRAALELVDSAAALQGSTRKKVILDLLRTRGGLRFATEVAAGECMARTEAVAKRWFSFSDRWANRICKHFFPDYEVKPDQYELEEEASASSSSSSSPSSAKGASGEATAAAVAAPSTPPKQPSAEKKEVVAEVDKPKSSPPKKAAEPEKKAAVARDEPPAPAAPKEKAQAKVSTKPKAKAKAKAKAQPKEKGKPPLPPGKHWIKYNDDGVLWYYYDGPLGKWWVEEGVKDIKPYKDD